MIEKIAEAFIGKVTENIFDLIFKKKDQDENKVEQIVQDPDKIKFIMEQKIEEEFKKLEKANEETELLASIRKAFIQRIMNLFKFFDIKQEEIPLFLKDYNITLQDVLYEEKLLEKFDDKVLDFLSSSFAIDKNWLYGRTDTMIKRESQGYYKRSSYFCEQLLKTNPKKLYILTNRIPDKSIDEKRDSNSIYLVAEYAGQTVNGRNISTYKIFNESCRYGYWRCRYELKRFLLCLKSKISIHIIDRYAIQNVSDKVYDFSKGRLNFESLLQGSSRWYPEDYVDLPISNSNAKENELDELRTIIDEYDEVSNY